MSSSWYYIWAPYHSSIFKYLIHVYEWVSQIFRSMVKFLGRLRGATKAILSSQSRGSLIKSVIKKTNKFCCFTSEAQVRNYGKVGPQLCPYFCSLSQEVSCLQMKKHTVPSSGRSHKAYLCTSASYRRNCIFLRHNSGEIWLHTTSKIEH